MFMSRNTDSTLLSSTKNIISNIVCNKLIQEAARLVTNENAFSYYLKITKRNFFIRSAYAISMSFAWYG